MCSQVECASNIIAITTGAGMLSLPYAGRSMGWCAVGLLSALNAMFMYSYVLLVASIDTVSTRMSNAKALIDYSVLGRESFGPGGDMLVMSILATELFLALVSFFINIARNINSVFPFVSMETVVCVAASLALALSFLDMRALSRVTAGGNVMTVMTMLALIASGISLPEHSRRHAEHVFLSPQGVPLSLGIMAYCYGGHGAFPKVYRSMAEKGLYIRSLSMVASVVFVVYGFFLVAGYWFYGNLTKALITENIGLDLDGHEMVLASNMRLVAAVGLVFNIQATCPIVVLTIADLYTNALGRKHRRGPFVMMLIVLSAALIALFLRPYFSEVVGLVGSLATITTSVFLPIAFYHSLHKKGDIPLKETVFHVVLVLVASCAMFVGVTSSLCGMFSSTSDICYFVTPSL